MQDLLRVLLRVNPSDMTRTQFKGALGLVGGPRTDDEILKLLQCGVNSPIEIDGSRVSCSGFRCLVVKAFDAACKGSSECHAADCAYARNASRQFNAQSFAATNF